MKTKNLTILFFFLANTSLLECKTASMPPQKEQREPHSIQKKKKRNSLTKEEERRRKERQSIFGYIALFVLVSTVFYGLTEEHVKNNVFGYYQKGIPPLPPSELESLWEAIEANRGFSPSRREKPFDLLTKEEQKKEIEEDLDALGKPYDTIIRKSKIQIKDQLLINNEKKFVIFDKVKYLHQKVQIYFKNGKSNLFLPNRLTEEQIFEKLAKQHISALKYIARTSPYYQNTRDLYFKYLEKDVLNESYTEGRTLYETVDNMGCDIDSMLAPYIKSDDDETLRALFEREYNSLDDLVLADSDPLKNGILTNAICNEENYDFNEMFMYQFSRILKGRNEDDQNLRPLEKISSRALLKAYRNDYIGQAHLAALMRYKLSGGHFSIGKHGSIAKFFFEKKKYFYVVYRDLLRRMEILNKNENYRFPNLGEIAGKKDFKGNINLYRGLKGNFYFDDFQTEGTYIESTSLDVETPNFFTSCESSKNGIILQLSVPNDTHKFIDLRPIRSDQSEILLIKGCPYKIISIYVK